MLDKSARRALFERYQMVDSSAAGSRVKKAAGGLGKAKLTGAREMTKAEVRFANPELAILKTVIAAAAATAAAYCSLLFDTRVADITTSAFAAGAREEKSRSGQGQVSQRGGLTHISVIGKCGCESWSP